MENEVEEMTSYKRKLLSSLHRNPLPVLSKLPRLCYN